MIYFTSAFLISWCPRIDGATERARTSNASFRAAKRFICLMAAGSIVIPAVFALIVSRLLQRITVRKLPASVAALGAIAL